MLKDAILPDLPGRPNREQLTQLRGAPRGMLMHYILKSISLKPRYGYEILQDIDGKTEGAWRPGAGSVYPILKKLMANGFIKADEPTTSGPRRAYSITPKGLDEVKNHSEMITNSWQRWMSMRRVFFDMIEPAGISRMFIEGSRKQFEFAKELMETRKESLGRGELDLMLREYSLNLERQLDWTQDQLKALRTRPAAPRLRPLR